MNREQELVDIISTARTELHSITDKRHVEELQQYVGKYYKYKNCYSCPESEKDYWYVYRYVKRISEYSLVIFEFEKDKHGKITIEPSALHSEMSGWAPCTPLEFANAWKVITDEILQIDY